MLMRMFIVYLLLVVTASPARADFTIPNVADAFNTAQAQVDSGDLAIVVMGMKGTGVVSGCAVTAQGSPDMTVAVASGTIRVAQTDATVTSGNVTITTADGTNPRFDLVVVNSSGTKSVTAGTPAANPVYPAIPASSVVLATVYVPASDTAIATNQITDKRVIVPNALTISSLTLTGAAPTVMTFAEGTAPGAGGSAGQTNFYVDSTTHALTGHINGGSAVKYIANPVPRRLWFPAAGCNNATAGSVWDLPTSNPAVAACKTGTNTQMGVLDFADSSNLSAQLHYILPTTWTGAIDARIKWLTSATSGSVVWQVSTICVADAETDDPSFNTASTVTDAAKGTTLQTNDAAISGVTVTGCAAGELMHIKIQRDSGHASDTLAATARLIGLELVIREAL